MTMMMMMVVVVVLASICGPWESPSLRREAQIQYPCFVGSESE